MQAPSPSIPSDYNQERRARAAPGAAAGWALGRVISLPVLTLVLIALLLPFDGPIARFIAAHQVRGDLRKELEAVQQFGQGASCILIALVIWLQDPARRRRLLTWGAALLAAFLIVFALKITLGRPRPKFDEPWLVLGPFGQYPVGAGKGVHHAWELGSGISADLWSMPSSHTAYACIAAVFLSALYPRLRVLVFSLAWIVGLTRILVHAHYPSDVAAGAGIGLVIGRAAVARSWLATDGSSASGPRTEPSGASPGPGAPPPLPAG